MNRNELAIEISSVLFNLYNELKGKKKNNEKVYFSPSIKDKELIKNCTPDSVEMFKQIVNERDSIIKYVLSTSIVRGEDIEEEYNDKNKITVIISDEDDVTIKYQYEIEEENFNKALEEIKKIISEKSDKNIKNVLVKREKPIREHIDFGILGKYQLDYIQFYDENGYTRSQINSKIKNIMKKFNENIDIINNRIFMKIYNIDLVGEALWDEEFFSEIIYMDKLPENFAKLAEEEKSDILYKISKLTEKDFENMDTNNLSFFNFKKMEEMCKIYNVIIEPEYKKISIEFHFLNKYMSPMIVLNYKNGFEVDRYESGY